MDVLALQTTSAAITSSSSRMQLPFKGSKKSPANAIPLTGRRNSGEPLTICRCSTEVNSPDRLSAVENAPNTSSEPTVLRDYLVRKVSGKEFEKMLNTDRKNHILADFYATWCGPCVVMAQLLETLAVQYQETVDFIKIDTDEEYELAQQLQIRGLPTILLISKDPSKPAIRTEGILPIETMRTLIETEL